MAFVDNHSSFITQPSISSLSLSTKAISSESKNDHDPWQTLKFSRSREVGGTTHDEGSQEGSRNPLNQRGKIVSQKSRGSVWQTEVARPYYYSKTGARKGDWKRKRIRQQWRKSIEQIAVLCRTSRMYK